MNYIAHCDGEREQSILEHLQGTAEKAKDSKETRLYNNKKKEQDT